LTKRGAIFEKEDLKRESAWGIEKVTGETITAMK